MDDFFAIIKVMRGRGIIAVFFATFLGVAGFASAAQLQSINFVPQGSYPTCARGTIFYSSSTDQFMLCTSSGGQPSPLVTGASNSWTLSGSSLYPSSTGYNVGIGTTNPGYKLDVNGVVQANATFRTPSVAFAETNRRAKDLSNVDIETVYGWQGNSSGKTFLQLWGFAPPTMYRTTGDMPAPYGIGFSNGSESGGIMPIGQGDNLQEIMFYGSNSGPTTFTWKHQVWESSTYDPSYSNYYSAPAMSLNANTGLLYVAGNVGIGTTTPTTAGLVVTKNVSSVGIDVSNNRIQNVGTPINAADATTKSYVDSAISIATSSQYWTLSGSNLYANSTGYNVVVGGTTVVDKLDVVGNLGVGGSSFNVGTMNGVSGQGIALPSTNNDSVRILGEYTNPDTSNGIFQTGDNTNDGWKFREVDCCGAGTLDYLVVERASPQIAIYSTTTDVSSIGVSNGFTTFTSSGSNPGYRFTGGSVDVNGNLQSSVYYDRDNTNYYMDLAANVMPYALNANGAVRVGGNLAVNGANVTLSSATQLILNSTSSAAIQMNQGSITGVYKLSVAVVDPLYSIGGVNYATYGPSIAGGVKEEYVGRGTLTAASISNDEFRISNETSNSSIQNSANQNSIKIQNSKLYNSEPLYSYVIDFNHVERGSDLWVWRKAVDFGPDTVQVLATPIGTPVPIAYQMDGNKIIFISRIPNTDYQIPDTGIEFSYRLVGARFDWRDWPTLSKDQSEKANLIIQ